VHNITRKQLIEGNPVVQTFQQIALDRAGIDAIVFKNRQLRSVIEDSETAEQPIRVPIAQACMDRTHVDAHYGITVVFIYVTRCHTEPAPLYIDTQGLAYSVVFSVPVHSREPDCLDTGNALS
jgi:hypothetical protein